MPAGDEGACAVHRIENPGKRIGRGLLLEFFSDDSIVRPLMLDDRANGLFGAFIRGSNRIEHAASRESLVRHRDSLPEIRTDHLPGSIRESMSERDSGGIDRHSKAPSVADPDVKRGGLDRRLWLTKDVCY